MRRLLVCLLLIVLLTSLASSPAVRAEDPPAQPLGNMMGMVVRDPHYEWNTNPNYPNDVNRAFYDAMGLKLAEAGVKWARIEIFAADSGPNAGRVDVEKYRYFINEVAPRHGIKVLALLATPLVRQRPEGSPIRFPGDEYPSGEYIPPERIEDPLTIDAGPAYRYVNPYMHIWLDNAFQVAKAFPYNKTTGAGIAAYEVLNEENRYLNGGGKGMSPVSVATLLTKFHRVFKQLGGPDGSLGPWRNDVKIILGGLHPDRCDDCGTGGMNDRQYLDALYKTSAFQGNRNTYGSYPLDGVGYHPYPMEMRSGLVPEPTGSLDLFRVPTRMDAMRAIMVQNGDTANKFWITEVGDRGAPITVDPEGDNEQRQAQFMRTIYWFLWRDRAFVENVFWFKYEDFAVPSNQAAVGPENWGVVRLKPGTTTEYDNSGAIDRVKLSFATYKDMAFNGLREYQTYLPLSQKE
ncbi:MAG TPA: hypothetical protein VFZ66_24585 [Herpetosiphonaceae bacterium]